MESLSTLRCYNCFHEKPDGGPCPHCGFDLEENVKKFPVALRAGTVLNGRYIVGRVLGQGGFGITYLAWDTQLDAKVAVKEFMPGEIATRVDGTTVSVMMDTRSEEFSYGAERFQEEARTLAKFIGNPNIAAVTSYFDENDTSYFVMDYIEGISFKTYIANQGGKVSVDEALNVMIPVLRALTAVHAEGFIHRDVTPDNIYITKDGMVKLLDFGSARYSIGDKSKSLDVVLKVGYAPKEQYIRRGRQGPYTDVYSCAACFYAALTGYLPPEALERMDNDTLIPVSQAGVELPEWLDKAILKGLAVQPEDRFQSASEFLDAIENQLVVEVPVSGGTPAPAPAKKKPLPLILAGVAAVLAVAVGIGAFMGGGNRGGGEDGSAASGKNSGPALIQAEVPSITIQGETFSTDLQKLDLSDRGLEDSDIQDLKYMVNLYDLRLNGNRLTDLSPLAGLTRLANLQLRDNELSDLSPLAGLTELEELNLGGENAGVTDLSPLAGLTKLEYLSLSAKMEIADSSPLCSLVNLKSLSVDGSSNGYSGCFSDLSFLANMPKLESAHLNVNELSSLEGIQAATQLTSLNIRGPAMDLTDLSPLSALTNLNELEISGNGGSDMISTPDLAFLSGMKDLRTFRLSSGNGRVASLEGVQGAAALTELYLDGVREGADLSVLSGLTNLQSLYLYGSGNELPRTDNLNFLLDMEKLRIFHLSANGLNDCSGLSGCSQIQELWLGSSILDSSDLKVFSNLSQLRTVQFQAKGDVDLTPLSGLAQLREVTITGSDSIRDWSPLSHVQTVNQY